MNKNIKFDFIIDDGPHTFKSMIKFVTRYSRLLTDDGILILEDIPSIDWTRTLKDCVPDHLKELVQIHDLRPIKNRYDDIVLVVDKKGISQQ